MTARTAATAPVHLSLEQATHAIAALGDKAFPESIGVDDRHGLSMKEKVAVKMARLATLTWAVEMSPTGHSITFPEFSGRLTLVRVGPDAVQLVLRGNYTPPLGLLGAVADRLFIGRVANRSLSRFLQAAAREIEHAARWQRERNPVSVAVYPPDLRGRHV